jgi:hypothetical protein
MSSIKFASHQQPAPPSVRNGPEDPFGSPTIWVPSEVARYMMCNAQEHLALKAFLGLGGIN